MNYEYKRIKDLREDKDKTQQDMMRCDSEVLL